MASCHRGELSTSAEEERTAAEEHPARARLDDRPKGGGEITFVCGFHDQDLPANRSTSLIWSSASGTAGSNKAAMLADLGINSCSSPSRFAVKSTAVKTTPVTLPPGRLRLATRPVLIGSVPVTNTIGTAAVAAMAARVAATLPMMTAAWRRTR